MSSRDWEVLVIQPSTASRWLFAYGWSNFAKHFTWFTHWSIFISINRGIADVLTRKLWWYISDHTKMHPISKDIWQLHLRKDSHKAQYERMSIWKKKRSNSQRLAFHRMNRRQIIIPKIREHPDFKYSYLVISKINFVINHQPKKASNNK